MTVGETVLLWMIGSVIFGLAVLAIIRSIPQRKQKTDGPTPGQASDEMQTPLTVTLDAKVTDQYCRVVTAGTKSPKTKEEYFVCFEAEDGREYKLAVSSEYYQALSAGQRGRLTLVNGQLYSFVLYDENLT
jgi:hypothetical protein